MAKKIEATVLSTLQDLSKSKTDVNSFLKPIAKGKR